jgi:hypothetical protein
LPLLHNPTRNPFAWLQADRLEIFAVRPKRQFELELLGCRLYEQKARPFCGDKVLGSGQNELEEVFEVNLGGKLPIDLDQRGKPLLGCARDG